MSAQLLVRADAFSLPFADETFEVVVADPPYVGRNRGKRGVVARDVGYIGFRGREWWDEAWRVLRPAGHLYVLCAIRELGAWLNGGRPLPVDVVSWIAHNAPSLAAYWRRGMGNRACGWRPIIHWQKPPLIEIEWPDVEVVPGQGRKRNGKPKGRWVDPNFWIGPTITGIMREALPWPNQLPLGLMRWLLRPHKDPVLDLFSGTGTTRVAAATWALNCVSVDLSEEALRINADRAAQLGLAAATP